MLWTLVQRQIIYSIHIELLWCFLVPEGKGKLDFNAHGVVGKALRLRNLALVG